MRTLAFTVTDKIYTFHAYTGRVNLSVGSILVDFAELDMDAFITDKQIISDRLLAVFFDNRNESYYDELSGQLAVLTERNEQKYNPAVVQLLVNGIETVESETKWLDSIKGLQASARDIVTDPGIAVPQLESMYEQHPELYELERINVRHLPDNGKLIALYNVDNMISLLLFDIFQIITYNVTVRHCKNCGRLFIPVNRSDELYCNRAFAGKKTCRDVGYNLNMDDFQREFRKFTKKIDSRIRLRKEAQPNYSKDIAKPLLYSAEQARDEYREKNDLQGFKRWTRAH